jgi:hypothetical protein
MWKGSPLSSESLLLYGILASMRDASMGADERTPLREGGDMRRIVSVDFLTLLADLSISLRTEENT